MTKYNEIASQLHAHLCVCPKHGYSQGTARYGTDNYCEVTCTDGVKYRLRGGDRDCSSSVCEVWQKAIANTPYAGRLDGATWTGNMRQVFVDSGLFTWHPMGDGYVAQTGDIYLNDLKHTALCQSADPDLLSEFYLSENGTIYGQQGDQTGWESRIRAYYDFPWTGILAYNHKADTEEDDMPTAKEIAEAVWNKDVRGMSAGERLYLDNAQLFDRIDHSTGEKGNLTPIERISYIDAKLDAVDAKLDELLGRL